MAADPTATFRTPHAGARRPHRAGARRPRPGARASPVLARRDCTPLTRCSRKWCGGVHNGSVTLTAPGTSSEACDALVPRRLVPALVLPLALAVGCTQANEIPASTAEGPSSSSRPSSALPPSTGPACESPRRSPDGALEGSSVAGELWALGGRPRVGEDFKIVVRATGSGQLSAVAISPTGSRHKPIAAKEHSISNFNRPGDEWGLFFTFDRPGCWRIHVSRAGLRGFVALRVHA